ncbi:MAG TPA: trypsin-like serine protease [Anaerolineae bacterium]|nr:trypsin-like serine protease [Anaerolineae bacterium]
MRNLKSVLIALVLIVGLLAASFGAAYAITNGRPDGEEHPYVGLAVFDDAEGNPMWRCSGTLLSPTLFLTAGHCTEAPAASATIWFESDVQAGRPENGYPFGGPTSVEGTPYTHPDYDPGAFYLHDLGVVILDTPLYMGQYGTLPEEGMLDALATRRGLQDVTFTAVGYGLQRINPVFVEGYLIRLQATLRLIDLKGTAGIPAGTSVILSNNARTGGTCFGDSGGPLFYDATNIVAAVTSFGLNGNCAGVGGGYRVDTADDLNWLYGTFGAHLP